MTAARRSTMLACAIVALWSSSVAAASSGPARFAGRTAQGAPISFTVSKGHVRKLRFTIYIDCRSGHVYRIWASNFPPIQIRQASFDQKFVARGDTGSATVKGRVSGPLMRGVSGVLSDRTFEPREHRYCAATTRFSLHR